MNYEKQIMIFFIFAFRVIGKFIFENACLLKITVH